MTGAAVCLHSRVYFVSTLNVTYDLQNTLKVDITSYDIFEEKSDENNLLLSVIWCFVGMRKEF